MLTLHLAPIFKARGISFLPSRVSFCLGILRKGLGVFIFYKGLKILSVHLGCLTDFTQLPAESLSVSIFKQAVAEYCFVVLATDPNERNSNEIKFDYSPQY
jgi:hypothetical protein